MIGSLTNIMSMGILTIILALIFLLVFFFVSVFWNSFLYWLGSSFLKYEQNYGKIFSMFLKITLITWGVSILGAILLGAFSLIPGGMYIAMGLNMLLSLIIMVLLYYLTYKFGISSLKLDEKKSLYATLTFFVLKIIFFIIGIILTYILYGLFFISLLSSMGGGMMPY